MHNNYLQNLLGESERILLAARQHWFVLSSAIALEVGVALGVLIASIVAFVNFPPAGFASLLIFLPLASLLHDLLVWSNRQYVVTNRRVMHETASGRQIVVTDSIVFGTEADRRNVLVTAGHTGRSGARHIINVGPFGFICSDGGRGRNDSGMAGLEITATEGIAGATVDAHLARMGDGMSTYEDGIISAANRLAQACGVRVGMSAREAALLLVNR